MFVARDKDGTLYTHKSKPIRAQYGRSVKDTFGESDTKQVASDDLKTIYKFMHWEHEPIKIKG